PPAQSAVSGINSDRDRLRSRGSQLLDRGCVGIHVCRHLLAGHPGRRELFADGLPRLRSICCLRPSFFSAAYAISRSCRWRFRLFPRALSASPRVQFGPGFAPDDGRPDPQNVAGAPLTRFKGAWLGLFALFIVAGTVARQRPEGASASAAPTPSPAPTVVAPTIVKPGPHYPFRVGQTLVYSGVWRIFDAGMATLRMEPAGTEMRLTGTANATGAVALLYHVHDHYESLFNPATFCSQSTSRRIEEGL